MFQFTRPRGARPHRDPDYTDYEGFNSHARVGRDLIVDDVIDKWKGFNSHARVGRD